MYTLVCEICGETFETTQPKKKCCDKQHYGTCAICGKKFPINKRNWKTKKCCSRACLDEFMRITGKTKTSTEKANRTKKEKYYDKGISFNVPQKQRVCEICGKTFQPEAPNQKICSGKHVKKCEVCGSEFEVHTIKEYRNRRTCSRSCKYKLVKMTSLNRYGVSNVMRSESFKSRVRKTNLERYGVSTPFESSDFKEKSQKTCIERYGVPYATQSEEVQRKIRRTMQERYGVDYYPESDEYVDKTRKTCEERYGVPWPCLSVQSLFGDSKNISSNNTSFASVLEVLSIPFELEFVLEDRSYDIRVGTTLVEIDPTSTHNSFVNIMKDKSRAKDSQYHLNKTKLAESHGYRCIHVWDWDDWDKIVQLLLPTESVYARKCQIEELDKRATDDFLNTHHLQGSVRGQTKRYGLYYQGRLVEVMTFGRPRYNRKFEWELLRLCTESGITVVGGASKLFKYFLNSCNPSSVISYCDRSKFSGSVYKSIGMDLVSEGTPNKHWYSPKKSERMQHITNNFLLQRGYDQIFDEHYGKGTSNEQLMLDRGYLPVYDCGQMRFEWHS